MISATRVYGDDGRVRVKAQIKGFADYIEIVAANDGAADTVMYAIEAGISVIRRTTITGGGKPTGLA